MLNKPEQQVPSFLSSCVLVRLLIGLTTSDEQNMILTYILWFLLNAINNRLMLKSTQAAVVVDDDGFRGSKTIAKSLNTEYAVDVDGLCNEVNMIYLEKLNKVNPQRLNGQYIDSSEIEKL